MVLTEMYSVGSASSLPVLQVSGNVVGVITTILQASSYLITIDGHPGISTLSDGNVEVKTANESGGGEKIDFILTIQLVFRLLLELKLVIR